MWCSVHILFLLLTQIRVFELNCFVLYDKTVNVEHVYLQWKLNQMYSSIVSWCVMLFWWSVQWKFSSGPNVHSGWERQAVCNNILLHLSRILFEYLWFPKWSLIFLLVCHRVGWVVAHLGSASLLREKECLNSSKCIKTRPILDSLLNKSKKNSLHICRFLKSEMFTGLCSPSKQRSESCYGVNVITEKLNLVRNICRENGFWFALVLFRISFVEYWQTSKPKWLVFKSCISFIEQLWCHSGTDLFGFNMYMILQCCL